MVPSVVTQNNSTSFPRVAFDTSVLGYARYGAGGRTGVYRMVEGLVEGLAASDQCDLLFCGGEDLRMWVHAHAFIRSHPKLKTAKIAQCGSPARVYRFLDGFFREMACSREVALPTRAIRKALGEVLRRIDSRVSVLEPAMLVDRDIYHSPFYPLPALTKQKHLKRFLSVCDLINIQHPEVSRDGGAYMRHILASADADDWFITISETTREALCEYRRDIDPKRVLTVPLAASDMFHPADTQSVAKVKRRLGIRSDYFLSLCTLDKRKNLEGLVDAFAEWTKANPKAQTQLVLAGSLGESTLDLHRRIAQTQLVGRVAVTGYLDDSELAPLYSGATAFVYPSFYEGFGLPILEAMQCGVPVLSSTDKALREVGGDAVRYFDPRSRDAIVEALDTAYRSESAPQDWKSKGLLRARSFSWSNSAAQLLAAYRQAL